MRLILLDKVVFQQECILFAIYYYVAYISNVRYELTRFRGLMLLVEIAIYPPVKILSLADIDNLPVLIKVLVYTRLLRYAF